MTPAPNASRLVAGHSTLREVAGEPGPRNSVDDGRKPVVPVVPEHHDSQDYQGCNDSVDYNLQIECRSAELYHIIICESN